MKNEEGRWVVLEINRACQFEGFEKSTAINVAGRIVEYLAK
jgi:glutathione synthase/RimK-type ligase-like ATP-grasp enzyme